MGVWIIVIILLAVFFPMVLGVGGTLLGATLMLGIPAVIVANIIIKKQGKKEEKDYKNKIEELKETISVEYLEKEVLENLFNYFLVNELEELKSTELLAKGQKLTEQKNQWMKERAKYRTRFKETFDKNQFEYNLMKMYDKEINLCIAQANILYMERKRREEKKK